MSKERRRGPDERYRYGWCCDHDFENGTYRTTSECIGRTRNADVVERLALIANPAAVPATPVTPPSDVARKAAAEIAARWFNDDLPQVARVQSLKLLQLRILAERVISRHLAVVEGDETGWLLEKMHNGNVHYISADYVLQWIEDPNKALRLARRKDAEALSTIIEDCEKIAEHAWVPPVSNNDENKQRQGYCWVCRSSHVLTAGNCRAMDGIG